MTPAVDERAELEGMISRGKADARKLAHARVLLQADEAASGQARTDEQVAAGLNVNTRTVDRVRQRFIEDWLQAALLPRPTKRVYARVLDGKQEAHLVALVYLAPAAGEKRWTLRLLAGQVVELGYADAASHETVRRVLKKRAEAPPAEDVVHPAEGERRVRGPHGGRAGGVPPAARPGPSGGMHGRV